MESKKKELLINSLCDWIYARQMEDIESSNIDKVVSDFKNFLTDMLEICDNDSINESNDSSS